VTFQSDRAAAHRAAVERLLASGAAYRDFGVFERRPAGRRVVRPARWRELLPDASRRHAEAGERFVVRLRVDDDRPEVFFEDVVFGPRHCPRSRVEDFVLLRGDGSATYHLATVVDDADEGVSLVMRGQEHLPSTTRQVLLYEALGLTPPRFAHLPLLFRPRERQSGQRRRRQRCLEDFRDASVIPSALRNALALLGWSPPSGKTLFLDDDELSAVFDLGRVARVPVFFDDALVMKLNELHLRHLPPDRVVVAVAAELERRRMPPIVWAEPERESQEMAIAGVDLARGHASTIGELVDRSSGLLGDDFEVDDELLERVCKRLPVAAIVDALLRLIAELEPTTWEVLNAGILDHVMGRDLSSREVRMVLQLALTGSEDGPPLEDVFGLLGRERVAERLRGLSMRCDPTYVAGVHGAKGGSTPHTLEG